jgi:hypothetical protein
MGKTFEKSSLLLENPKKVKQTSATFLVISDEFFVRLHAIDFILLHCMFPDF